MDGAALAKKMAADHRREIKELAERYIGKTAYDHGQGIADPWAKKTWLMHRIFDLGEMAGHANRRSRRCRNLKSEILAEYEKTERDCQLLAENLMLQVMMIR